MSDSILVGTKKALGLDAEENAFDPEIIMYINTTLATITQLGVGPPLGFRIEDESETWESFLGSDPRLNHAKSYVYARVRLLFDPPTTGHHITALKEQALEFEWRLREHREEEAWTPPIVPVEPPLL